MRVLVVNDNVVNQEVAVQMLEHSGHRVDVADDGRDAIDAVGRSVCGRPHGLSDADHGGYEAAQAIRALEGPDGRRMAQLVETFNGRTVALLEELRSGIEVADRALVSRTSHPEGRQRHLRRIEVGCAVRRARGCGGRPGPRCGAEILLRLQAEADRVRPALRVAFPELAG